MRIDAALSGLVLAVRPRTGWLRLAAAERQALTWWLGTRLATYWVAALTPWLVGDNTSLPAYLDRWNRWDARVFAQIAEYGYDGPPGEPGQFAAFFPGLPLLLRGLHAVIPDYTVDGLLISLLAGSVAVVALVRIAVLDAARAVTDPDLTDPALSDPDLSDPDLSDPDRNDSDLSDPDRNDGAVIGRRAVAALCLAPVTGFLTAGYTEAAFVAFAFPAWLSARRGRWARAGLLAAGACSLRITGAFLVAALAVEFAQQAWTDRRRPAADRTTRWTAGAWLAVSAVPIVAFFGYLHARTGRWDAYFQAQQDGWARRFIGVRQTFELVWAGATIPADHTAWAFGYRMELAAMLTGLVLAGWLARRRRWAELCFVLLPVLALAPMSTYSSAARTSLVWWPLWIALATLSVRGRLGTLLTRAYLVVTVPLAILLTAAFTLWHWAG